MFAVEAFPPDLPPYKPGYDHYVVDVERGFWLQHIGGPHGESVNVFRFFWDGVLLLVEASLYAGSASAERFTEDENSQILSFGYSAYGSLKTGIHNDPLDRDRVLAGLPVLAEALLAFGNAYNGHRYPNRIVASSLCDVPLQWTWADFGYSFPRS